MGTQTLDRYIEVTPGVAGGKPCIAGRRITVQNMVIWHEWMGLGVDEIAANHDLTLVEIYAALAYYFNNPQEIDASIKKSQAFVAEMKKEIPSKLPLKFDDPAH